MRPGKNRAPQNWELPGSTILPYEYFKTRWVFQKLQLGFPQTACKKLCFFQQHAELLEPKF